ncbi:MAG: hypothetical protein WBA67_15755 [Jannaschia sp.]
MTRAHAMILSVLIFGIVVAHVFLWLSDMAPEAKLAFTVLNAIAWSVVLVPIWLVPRWLEAVRARNAASRDADGPEGPR